MLLAEPNNTVESRQKLFSKLSTKLRLPCTTIINQIYIRQGKHVANVLHLTQLSLCHGVIEYKLVASGIENRQKLLFPCQLLKLGFVFLGVMVDKDAVVLPVHHINGRPNCMA
jgi:hypothetical protein